MGRKIYRLPKKVVQVEPKLPKKQIKVSESVGNVAEDITQGVIHKEWPNNDIRQQYLNYAYKIGGKDFILTILAENSTMGIDRKSNLVGANGYSDYGLCQINVGWHPEVLGGSNGKKFKDWFYDPYKQLDYCNKLFISGTRFYGYDVRMKMEGKIDFL